MNAETYAQYRQTAVFVIQLFRTVAEDIFIRSVGLKRNVNPI